jgi:hypothetical protein
MNIKANNLICKFLYGALLVGTILALCFGAGGWQPAHAQAEETQAPAETAVAPEPTPTPEPDTPVTDPSTPPGPADMQPSLPDDGSGSEGAQRAPDGSWFMPEGARDRLPVEAQGVTALATGGPDDFGYTWNTVSLDWKDTTLGTDTGMSGSSYNRAVGPVSLPFSFKYYENTYGSLYITASGYLSFTDNHGSWRDQEEIPSSSPPNNVIAPYWSPLYIGTGSWVHYLSDPVNHSFVIEWHNVKGGAPGNSIGQDDLFWFETILYENGDIVFQYQTMDYNGNYWCGASGIEDSSGLDGLSTVGFCARAPSNQAVRFTRPAPSARLRVMPRAKGQFTTASELDSFLMSFSNTGEFGTDTFDLSLSSTWPASLYAADGETLLTDTDMDGKLDTGPVPQGGLATIILKVQTPGAAVLGDSNAAALIGCSSVDVSKCRTVDYKTAIPAPFVQAFEDDANGAMSLDLVQPHGQTAQKVTGNYYWGYLHAIASANGGNFVYVGRNGAMQKGKVTTILNSP